MAGLVVTATLTVGSVDADDGDDDETQDEGTPTFLPSGASIASLFAGGRKVICGVTTGTLIAGVAALVVLLISVERPTVGGISKLTVVLNCCTLYTSAKLGIA
jgi:hypothetical protein